MTELNTNRYQLPYLAIAQSQKELTHNEALLLIDALLHPVAEGVVDDPASLGTAPVAGKMWVVGPGATGAWTGRAGQLAIWSEAGWRFLTPPDAMSLWRADTQRQLRRDAGAWLAPPAVSAPTGGSVVDTEARAALGELAAALRQWGVLT